MNIRQRIQNGTFCVLPWIEKFYPVDGKHYFCCWGREEESLDQYSPIEIQGLRNKLLNGQRIDHCNHCYTMEASGTISPRITDSTTWGKHPDIQEYFSTITEHTSPIGYYYDLRYDNKCNLACITCNPTESSLWARELGIDSISQPIDIDFEDLKKVKKLYLAGGEPLLIEQNFKILDFIIDHNLDVEVVINTNLTTVSDKVLDKLEKLKDCCIIVSVDSFGKVNEYHRYPMSWDKFMTNLNAISDRKFKVMLNTVADAISVFGYDRLGELERFPFKWDIKPVIGVPQLDLQNIPTELKQQAVNSVEKLMATRFYKQDILFKKQVDGIIAGIKKEGEPFLLINYINILDNRRGLNHQDYIGIKLT